MFLAVNAGAEDSRPGVLIIYPYLRSFPLNALIDETLRREVPKGFGQPVELYSEFLEAEQFANERDDVARAQFVRERYRDRNIKVVVVIGALGLEFFLKYRDQMLPGVPAVYTIIAQIAAREFTFPPDVIGAQTTSTDDATLALALHLHPKAKQIYFVTGTGAQDRRYERLARLAAQRLTRPVAVEFLAGLTSSEMLDRLRTLTDEAIVYSPGYFVDGAGVVSAPSEIVERMSSVSGAPLYSRSMDVFGSGVVGGYVTSRDKQVIRASAMVVQLLRGVAPSEIAVDPISETPMFDWRQLQRWRIPESQLPPGAEVRFRPPSLWEQHRVSILAGAAIVVLQAILITALLLQRARRRNAEKQAAGLSGQLLTAHEDERRRLARELHDDLTQRLARLSVDAFHVERNAGAGAAQMRRDLVRLSEDVHAISYRLHPAVLDDLGLVEALRAECDRVAQHGELRVEVNAGDVPDTMPNEASLCLFRVAQEALNNAVRHGRANAITVLLAPRDSGLQLAVSDNGSGFDPEGSRKRASLGLASMRERVRLLHGQLDIESTPGRGTTVVAWVPA
jgi:signal transduction histidine kinase